MTHETSIAPDQSQEQTIPPHNDASQTGVALNYTPPKACVYVKGDATSLTTFLCMADVMQDELASTYSPESQSILYQILQQTTEVLVLSGPTLYQAVHSEKESLLSMGSVMLFVLDTPTTPLCQTFLDTADYLALAPNSIQISIAR